jgi:phosphoribosylaminoimidazole-succinocarboxamide synthase
VTTSEVLLDTRGLFPGYPLQQGKVRDIYDLDDKLLIITTDRISTYDSIHPNGIPGKGTVLTAMTLAWSRLLESTRLNHILSANVEDYPVVFHPLREVLRGRSMLVKKAKVIPVECVVRGYLYGSAFKEYQEKQSVNGIPLWPGLKLADKLRKPLFTPATKATSGHDENIGMVKVIELVGLGKALELQARSLRIYQAASLYAETRGIIIADTKFEFGEDENGDIILIDEFLTPDSSRFWKKTLWKPGKTQIALDKQPVRDYVDSIGWDHNPPAPELPAEVVSSTRENYLEIKNTLFPSES